MRDIKFRAYFKRKTRAGTMTYNPDLRTNTYKRPGLLIANFPENTVIMQYTGLKDKNGKEIYEGDIVTIDELDLKTKKQVTAEILYKSPTFLWRNSYSASSNFSHVCEIIGNIYENKELLNEEKKEKEILSRSS